VIVISSPSHITTASVVVLNRHSEILLVKHPYRGWELPGGTVKNQESIRAAVLREVKEKTGLDIRLVRFCGIFQNVRASICHTLFTGKPIGSKMKMNDESLDIGYFPVKIAVRLVTWKNLKQRILHCLDDSLHPFLVEF
jgi:8-oxo-dGTP diphosphatase